MVLAALYDDYLYGRVSEDDIGLEKNVQRQMRNCRAKSAATGGRVVLEKYDNDISALHGAQRPGFDELMAAITAPNPQKRQRRIVCQHTSRIWRNRLERAYGIDTLGRAKIVVVPIDGPTLDLTTAAGRVVAGILGETDTGESETKAERIQDAARERAQEGRAHAKVLYGWERVYQHDARGKIISFEDVIHERHAGIVREIVRRMLAGDPMREIARDLNNRRVPAPGTGYRTKRRGIHQDETGSLWDKTSVKRMALRPANIGLRPYHKGREDEEMLPGAFPALISPEDHQAIATLFQERRQPGGDQRPGARRYLLTHGIGACGRCESYLRTSIRDASTLYQCVARGCVGRSLEPVDEWVTEVMVALLERPDALLMLEGDSSVAAEALRRARNLRARLAQAADAFAAGQMEIEQMNLITARLRPDIEAAEAQAASSQQSPHALIAAQTAGDQARGRWAALGVPQRRAVMKAFGVRVFIDPVRKRGGVFDPADVRVVPRRVG